MAYLVLLEKKKKPLHWFFSCIWLLSWPVGKLPSKKYSWEEWKRNGNIKPHVNCHSRKIRNWIPALAIKHPDQTSLRLHWASQFFYIFPLAAESARKRTEWLAKGNEYALHLWSYGAGACCGARAACTLMYWSCTGVARNLQHGTCMHYLETQASHWASEVTEVAQVIIVLPFLTCS